MIKLYAGWALARIKANLTSLSFWMMTALMAIVLILTDRVIGEYSADTLVLLCAGDSAFSDEKPVSAGTWCVSYMCEHVPDGFRYETVDEADELIRRVSAGECSCGAVFADLAEADSEEMPEVAIYQSRGSADGYALREIIYPVLAEYGAEDELRDYVYDLYEAQPRGRTGESDVGDLTDTTAVDDDATSEVSEYIAGRYRAHMDELDLQIYDTVSLSEMADEDPQITESVAEDPQVAEAEVYSQRAAHTHRIVFAGLVILVSIMCIYDTVHVDRCFYMAFAARRRAGLFVVRVAINFVMSTTIALLISALI